MRLMSGQSRTEAGFIATEGRWPTQARVWLEWGSSTVRGQGRWPSFSFSRAVSSRRALVQEIPSAFLSDDSHFLFVREATQGKVDGFRVESDGSLTPVSSATGVPAGAQGIAAR
jgi:hypothetical protein